MFVGLRRLQVPVLQETEIVVVPLCPPVTLIEAGEAATEKSGTGGLITYVALLTPLDEYPLANATASKGSEAEMVIGPLYTVEPAVGVVPSVVK